MAKLAVVTGASRGLGLEIATKFANEGWQVIGTGISTRPPELPATVEYAQFDASDAKACEYFWQGIAKRYKDAEVSLVNNAGGYAAGSFKEVAFDEIHKMLHMNYLTAANMTLGLVKVTEKARIVNIVSSTANTPESKHATYGASKAAEKYFFQALQKEFKPEKYQITNLYPKSIATHGQDLHAINPGELAAFIFDQASGDKTFYMRDVTLFPSRTL